MEVTSGAVAQCGKEALPWPAAEPTPLVEAVDALLAGAIGGEGEWNDP